MSDNTQNSLPNNGDNKMSKLDKVKIVLVNMSDCRNIGSAARAMKTMGLSNLVLVDPIEMPNGQAQALAAGAAAGVTGAFNGLASNVSAAGSVTSTGEASAAGTAIGEGIGEALKFLSPEARDEEIDKYKEEYTDKSYNEPEKYNIYNIIDY